MPNVGTISVLSAWQEFLDRGHPDGVKKMPEDQYRETKLAFFAGFGASLILHRDEIADMTEDAAIAKMQDFVDEIALFLRKAADEFEKKAQEKKEVGALTPEMAKKILQTMRDTEEPGPPNLRTDWDHDFSPICRAEAIAIQGLKEKELQLWTRAKVHSMQKLGKPYPDLSALAREISKGIHMSPEAKQILAPFQVIDKDLTRLS